MEILQPELGIQQIIITIHLLPRLRDPSVFSERGDFSLFVSLFLPDIRKKTNKACGIKLFGEETHFFCWGGGIFFFFFFTFAVPSWSFWQRTPTVSSLSWLLTTERAPLFLAKAKNTATATILNLTVSHGSALAHSHLLGPDCTQSTSEWGKSTGAFFSQPRQSASKAVRRLILRSECGSTDTSPPPLRHVSHRSHAAPTS